MSPEHVKYRHVRLKEGSDGHSQRVPNKVI